MKIREEFLTHEEEGTVRSCVEVKLGVDLA